MKPTRLKALYSLAELSRMLGMHHQQVHRLLVAGGIELTLAGRSVLVPLSELESKMPRVLESVVLVEALRESNGTQGTGRTRGASERGVDREPVS